jgi:hypothetical protein
MKTYEVVAKCKTTPNCKGMPCFGTTTADSEHALAEQLRNFSPQQSTCPVCQKTALYSFQDYGANPLDE